MPQAMKKPYVHSIRYIDFSDVISHLDPGIQIELNDIAQGFINEKDSHISLISDFLQYVEDYIRELSRIDPSLSETKRQLEGWISDMKNPEIIDQTVADIDLLS